MTDGLFQTGNFDVAGIAPGAWMRNDPPRLFWTLADNGLVVFVQSPQVTRRLGRVPQTSGPIAAITFDPDPNFRATLAQFGLNFTSDEMRDMVIESLRRPRS